jgi:hypothetical protein
VNLRPNDQESHILNTFDGHPRKTTPVLALEGNPWLELAGMFKDDPFAVESQESIAAYRRALDALEEEYPDIGIP